MNLLSLFPRKKYRWTRLLASGVAIAVVGNLVVAASNNKGERADAMELGSGQAWFGSPSTGTVALVDGTGTRVTHKEVPGVSTDFNVVQAGSSALVVDKTQGTVSRVDGATWTVGRPEPLGSPNDKALVVHTNARGTVAWVISRESQQIQEVDATTLAHIGPTHSPPGEVTGAGVTNDGALWTTNATGEVRSYKDGHRVDTELLRGFSQARVVMAGDVPVVVDVKTRAARVVGSGKYAHRSACLDVAPDAIVSSSAQSSPWVMAVAPDAGTLVVSRLDTGNCQPPIALGNTGEDRYGEAVEKGGFVFVPDFLTGEVIVVQPDDPTRPSRKISMKLSNTHFRLFVHNDHVWFDDPAGDRAGVITEDFNVLLVSKNAGPDGVPGEKVAAIGSDVPKLSCTPQPAKPQAKQTVRVVAVLQAGVETPSRYSWSAQGGSLNTTAGPEVAVTFDNPGVHEIKVDARIGSETAHGTCSVDVQSEDSIAQTSPPPPASSNKPTSEQSPSIPPKPPAGSSAPGGSDGPNGPTATTASTAPPPQLVAAIGISTTTPSIGSSVIISDATQGEHSIKSWHVDGVVRPSEDTSERITVQWSNADRYLITLVVASSDGTEFPAYVWVDVSVDPVIPDLQTLRSGSLEDAKTLVSSLGFEVSEGEQRDSIALLGSVAEVEPASGGQYPRGTAVKLFPSTGHARAVDESGDLVLGNPVDIASDDAGNLYVTDRGRGKVMVRQHDSDAWTALASFPLFRNASFFTNVSFEPFPRFPRETIEHPVHLGVIAVNSSGTFVCVSYGGNLIKIDVATGTTSEITHDGNVIDIAQTTGDNFIVVTNSDSFQSSRNLYFLNPDDTLTPQSNSLSGAFEGNEYLSLVSTVTTPSGEVYAAGNSRDSYQRQIFKRRDDNSWEVYVGSMSEGSFDDNVEFRDAILTDPRSLTSDPFGNIYFINSYPDNPSSDIRMAGKSDQKIHEVIGNDQIHGTGPFQPAALTITRNGEMYYISNLIVYHVK